MIRRLFELTDDDPLQSKYRDLVIADSQQLCRRFRFDLMPHLTIAALSFRLDPESENFLCFLLRQVSTSRRHGVFARIILAAQSPRRSIRPILNYIAQNSKDLLDERRIFRTVVPRGKDPNAIHLALGVAMPISKY